MASREPDAIVARLAATLHAVDTTASNQAPSQVITTTRLDKKV